MRQTMRKFIIFMALMKEVYFIFYIHLTNQEVFLKVFKDNQSCITVADYNKFSPITKNIAIKYHHLLSFVKKKIIWICYIDTREQTVEIFTKTLDKVLLFFYEGNYLDGDFRK